MSKVSLAFTLCLFAAGLPGAGGAEEPIRQITIQGNDRTDRGVIERALGVTPGAPISEDALPALRQRLLNLRLFSAVQVEKRSEEAGTDLVVTVEERWTLIPIPLLGGDDSGFRVGAALVESNLFGRRKLLVTTAIYSERKKSAFAMYRDPELLGTAAVLALDLRVEDLRRERADGFDVIDSWRDRRFEASVRPGATVLPRLVLRLGPFVTVRQSRAVDAWPAPPPVGTDLGLIADLEYDGQDLRHWYAAGLVVRASLRRATPSLGSDRAFTAASGHATWVGPSFDGAAITLSAAGYSSTGDPVLDAFVLGGKPGTRGFRTDGIWAERALTSTIDHQVPVWSPNWGTLTVSTFADAGVSTWRGQQTRWLSPGIGTRLYLRNVAIPATGLDFAWRIGANRPAVTFFVGF
jgi:outer membrane protein assembly factor BamA